LSTEAGYSLYLKHAPYAKNMAFGRIITAIRNIS